ncbi:MAG: Ig-like domain-containing protein [Gemmatimonadaceae bacterium]|nr:Ig-like domain-containing protein [Gemmatimonadaceae bacterium]
MSRPRRSPVLRPVVVAGALLGLSLLSCGREITGPGAGVRIATGLSFISTFPAPLASVAAGAGAVVPFDRVRVVFRRTDGTLALDSMVAFPSNADSIALDLRVPLSSAAGSGGEPLALTLAYVNAAGDTVFRGGPVQVIAEVRAPGSPPPAPAPVALTYTGPGADAATVTVDAESLSVVAGDPFTVTATARDGQGNALTGVPLVFTSLDPVRALIASPASGAGATLPPRGLARVRVQLPTGAAEDTAYVTVQPRPGTLTAASGANQVALAGTPLPQPVSVRLLATDGQPLAGAAVTVAVTAGGGSVAPTSGTTDANGFHSFTWTLGLPGAQGVSVTSPGVSALAIAATASPNSAVALAILQEPGPSHLAGDSLPLLLVEARNAGGVRDTTFADSVTLDFASAPAGATITGVARVRASAGVARFEDYRLTRAGTYQLRVAAPGVAPDTTATLTIAPRAASALVLVSGGGQVALPGAALAAPVVLRVTDPFGNGVAGVAVGFGVASGSLSAPADTSDAAGLVSVTWTLGVATGAQTLTATSVGLSGSPLVVGAIGSAAVASTTVTPALDTLTAIGAQRLLAASARDGANNIVAGTFTWATRDPAIASVNDSGRVVAVANGATWVVVTEAGGTRDSARVVVQQRLATIRVTPDPRTIYLGAAATFTAQAVDGLNVPLASQPAITWSVTSTAIASVDSTGRAIGVGLGSTQVRATAASVTGTAQLTVRTPITRIVVVRDSTGFTAADTFSLAALGRTRSYRAVAHDTLDAPMTGIAFTWASSNPSVAALDSVGPATARASAAANGVTAIRASAQGVQGAAQLTVQQVMTSIELSPPAVAVAPTGSVVLTARRRDANGFFIPGGSFTFASSDSLIATVTAAGVVTGVAQGTAQVTATSGTVTSPATTVTVTTAVPPVISFGRDTLAIGRSAVNVGIPVYLSRPSGGPVTVALAVADTFAFLTQATITIPAGQTVGTAQLNGRNAGSTRILATDGGTTGYAGDTAVLAVQAGVRFTSGGYSVLVNDEVGTQVLLTDPAPAGGAYITYTFGTPGRASVSPDPAFIPQGQLSANVVLRAEAAGATTITPAAAGVTGTASNFTAVAAALQVSQPWPRVGAGQFRDDWYAYAPQNVNTAVPVTLASSDTAVAVITPAIAAIPGGSYYVYFRVDGRAPGAITLTGTASGWTPATRTLQVTTPMVTLSGGGTLNTTSPQAVLTAYSADSARGGHWRASALALQLSSSDTSVIRILTPSATIAAGQYFTNGLRVIPGGQPGTAWVRVSASGHGADSVLYTVVGPRIRLSMPTARVGVGQMRTDAYVYTPDNVTQPLVVRLQSSDPAVATMPDSVIIPAGTYYAYLTVRGVGVGTTQLRVSAAGYTADSIAWAVTPARAALSGGGTYDNFAPPAAITAYTADTTGQAHYAVDTVVFSYSSSDTTVLRVTAADTVLPGGYFANHARVSFIGVGTAYIRVTAPGYRADSVAFTVRTPRIQFSLGTYRIGRRQFRLSNEFYVYTPNNVSDTLPVTITQTNAAADSLSGTSLRIVPGLYYAYFGFAGLQTGTDTLIVSAPGYLPDTAIIVITTPRLTGAGIPGTATTTSPLASTTVYVTDSVGNAHYSLDSLLLAASTSDAAVIQPEFPALYVARGAYFVQPRIRFVGPGSATVTYRDSLGTGYGSISSNPVTVTGPSLGFVNNRPVLGMRQYGLGQGAYVTIPNAIGTPLVVRLVSTDPAVATVPDSVIIPTGQTFAYVDVRAQDVIGTVQLQASAVGYGPANTTQQVTAPRFALSFSGSVRTTQGPQAITVQATDANGNAHYVWEAVTVQFTSSNPGAAAVDSASVTIPAGNYYNNAARLLPVAPGTTTITASDPRAASYRYTDAAASVSVTTPPLQLTPGSPITLGRGQWVEPYVHTLDNQPAALVVTLTHSGTATGTPATATIPGGSYYAYHRISALAAGTDTITYTASGHAPLPVVVTVGAGRVDGISGWPGALTSDSVAVTLQVKDPSGGVRNVTDPTTFTIAVTGGALEVRSGGAAVTSVTVPANGSQVTFYLRRLANGTGFVTFSNADYTTYAAPGVVVSGAP